MNRTKEVKGEFKYDKDSKRYHRFKISADSGNVVGLIYISKDYRPLPHKLILERKQG